MEAESVAYTVCQHYGIDTSDYSFGYIAGWSGGKEMPELKESLSTIRAASSEMIGKIDEKLQELTREKSADRDIQLSEKAEDSSHSEEEKAGEKTSVLKRLDEKKEQAEKKPAKMTPHRRKAEERS